MSVFLITRSSDNRISFTIFRNPPMKQDQFDHIEEFVSFEEAMVMANYKMEEFSKLSIGENNHESI